MVSEIIVWWILRVHMLTEAGGQLQGSFLGDVYLIFSNSLSQADNLTSLTGRGAPEIVLPLYRKHWEVPPGLFFVCLSLCEGQGLNLSPGACVASVLQTGPSHQPRWFVKCEPLDPERKHVLIPYSFLAEDWCNVLSVADWTDSRLRLWAWRGEVMIKATLSNRFMSNVGWGQLSVIVGLMLPTFPSEGKEIKGGTGD